jgi:hypothetical protein
MNITIDIGPVIAAIVGVGLFYLTKRQEWNGERRRFKIERYAEVLQYLSPLYNLSEAYKEPDKVRALSKAVNEANLMAGREVIDAVVALMEASATVSGSAQSPVEVLANREKYFNDLVLAMRADVEPGSVKGFVGAHFPLILTVLVDKWSSR